MGSKKWGTAQFPLNRRFLETLSIIRKKKVLSKLFSILIYMDMKQSALQMFT